MSQKSSTGQPKLISVRAKLLFWFLILAVVPLAAASMIAYQNTRKEVQQEVYSQLEAVGAGRTQAVRLLLELQREELVEIASGPDVHDLLHQSDTGSAARVSDAFEQIISRLPSFVEVNLVGLDRTILAATNTDVIGQNLDQLHAHDHEHGDHVYGDEDHQLIVHQNPLTGVMGYDLETPVYHPGTDQIEGYVVAHLNTDYLNRITTERQGLGQTGEVYIVDEEGNLVTELRFEEGAEPGERLESDGVIRALTGGDADDVYTDYRGEEVLGAHFNLTEYGWVVMAEIDEREAFAPMIGLRNTFIYISGIAVLGIIFISTLVANSLARPIVEITDTARAIVDGDLTLSTRVRTCDEIGQLAQAFNHMVSNLRETLLDVQQKVEYLNSIPAPVSVIDREFNLQFINQSGASMLNLTQESALGMKCYDLFKMGDCETDHCAVYQAMQRDETVTRQTNAEGLGDCPVQYTGASIKNEQGDIVGGLEYITEISSLKEAEQSLLLVNEFLQNRIQATIGEITSMSAEMLATSSEQAVVVNQQAAAVSQTSSKVQEARQTAEQSAERARDVAELAQQSLEIASHGMQTTQESVASIVELKEQVNTIAGAILSLSEQTQQIGEIITSVKNIADQSSMLALNASIEAARAGETGKGFSVVAGEVRSLAEQSRIAAEQVQQILVEIQKAANSAVMVTEEGARRADLGFRQMDRTGDSIRSIMEQVQMVAQAAQVITASAGQQLSGMDQIGSAIESINEGALQTQAGAVQTEESARNLAQMAEELATLVAGYSRENPTGASHGT